MRINKRLREVVVEELARMSDYEFRKAIEGSFKLRRTKKEETEKPKGKTVKSRVPKPGAKKRGRKPKVQASISSEK